MPTYYARNTAVQLSVADLARTATVYPRIRQGPTTYEEISANAAEFVRASQDGTLDETPLKDKMDSSALRFLGTHKNMPFLMVRAGEFYFDMNTDRKRNRRPIRMPMLKTSQPGATNIPLTTQEFRSEPGVNGVANDQTEVRDQVHDQAAIDEHRRKPCAPPLIPHALCLTVFLSKASFIRSYGEIGRRFNDIKIEVFFNGQLCASTFVPARCRADGHDLTSHIIRFTGCRVGRVLEKPWVIIPPEQELKGETRQQPNNGGVNLGAEQRWASISKALVDVAGNLERDKEGKQSVLEDYLLSLAKLDMPSEAGEMQRAGGLRFGVIDVVVMTGKGHKDEAGHPFLMEPKPIRSCRPEVAICKDIVINSENHLPSQPEVRTVDDVDVNTKEVTSGQPPTRASVCSQPVTLETPKPIMHQLKSTEDTGVVVQSEHIQSTQSDNGSGESALSRKLPASTPNLRSVFKDISAGTPQISLSKNAGRKNSSTNEYDNVDLKYLTKPRQMRYSTGMLPSSTGSIQIHEKRRRVTGSAHPSKFKSFSNVDQADCCKNLEKASSGANLEPKVCPKSKKIVSLIEGASQPKRARFHYEIVHDNKMTLAEEMAYIATEAGKPEAYNGSSKAPRVTRQSLANAQSNTSIAEVEHKATGKEKNIKRNKSAETIKTLPPKQPTPQQPNALSAFSSPLSTKTSNPTPSTLRSPFCPPFNLIPSEMVFGSYQNHSTPCPPRRGSTTLHSGFSTGTQETESLHDDSVLTYAPEGVLRQVRGERGGWFEEEGVVMGVRFLVG